MGEPSNCKAKRNDDQDVNDANVPFVSRELANLCQLFFPPNELVQKTDQKKRESNRGLDRSWPSEAEKNTGVE